MMKETKNLKASLKLSVILVCYNQEQFIIEALQSILDQEMPSDWELVVADDCSTDSTFDLIFEKLKGTDISVKYLPRDENLGLGPNMERAFEACCGEYIAVLEGDDYWVDKQRIKKHLVVLDQNHDYSFSFNTQLLFHQHKQEFENFSFFPPELDLIPLTVNELIRNNVVRNVSSCVFRSTLVSKIKSYIFDFEPTDRFYGIFMAHYSTAVCINEALTVYRINSNGIWSGLSKKEQLRYQLSSSYIWDAYFEFQYERDFSVYRLIIHLLQWRETLMKIPEFLGRAVIRKFFYIQNLQKIANYMVFRLKLKF